MSTPAAWVRTDVGAVELGDPRRTERLTRLVTDLAAKPTASLPTACGDWAATKAAYRFWANPAIAPAAILTGHQAATVARVQDAPLVLALQDTTAFDFSHHPATTDLGPLATTSQQGLLVHTVLAVTPDGVPQGVVQQQCWARDPATRGSRHHRRQRPTAAKESQRWLDGLTATHSVLTTPITVLTIADREADLYDLFARPRPPSSHLLIRATHNRRVTHEARYLWDAVQPTPVTATLAVPIGRRGEQPPREARVTVRFLAVALRPPNHPRPDPTPPGPVPVVALLAEEPAPPPATSPVRWLLLTTWPVTTGAAAAQCVRWYALRWLVERYHYVLKSGCRLEALQLHTADRLERALATYALVAWRLLWLTYLARAQPDTPCTHALTTPEWHALVAHHTQCASMPPTPPTLAEATRWIGQLGGHLGRTGDGAPGVKTLWTGLQRLHDMADIWTVLHPDLVTSDPPP
jgi:hypothetical protein